MTMAMREKALPATMIAPESGEILTRGVRPWVAEYKGQSITVDLPGYYPAGAGDGVHVGKDMSVVDEAIRTLKEKVDGLPSPATIRRIRAKLKLSQREAGALLKVGENAFDKYERGLIEPSGPTGQLIKILDRHPEIADELLSVVGRPTAPT
jgi:HTH-type transcriptional regulator/antitoxin MqsA